jgi:hypothetical protein
MKTFRLILSVVMAFAMVSFAYAGTVTVNGQSMGTLGSMSVTSGGDVTITTSGGPPPGGLSLSLSPASLPGGIVDVAYSQTVTMTASNGTPPYTFDCSATDLTATPSGAVCTISGTPQTAGVYSVNFSVTDNAGDTIASPILMTVSAPGGGSGELAVPPPGEVLNQTIAAYDAQNYYIDLSQSVSSMTVYITTRDWYTNQDLLVSDVGYPSCDQIVGNMNLPARGGPAPWYSITSNNIETVRLAKSFSAGQRLYITVCNQHNGVGAFAIYYGLQ